MIDFFFACALFFCSLVAAVVGWGGWVAPDVAALARFLFLTFTVAFVIAVLRAVYRRGL